jgi:hypothetical protein
MHCLTATELPGSRDALASVQKRGNAFAINQEPHSGFLCQLIVHGVVAEFSHYLHGHSSRVPARA